MAELLKTPDEWIAERPGLHVLDPDGWRGRDGRPWTDPITEAEFTRRLWMCTLTWPGVTSPPYAAASHSTQPETGQDHG